METNLISRTFTGIILILGGIFLIILPFFMSDKSGFFIWIYGVLVLIIGIFILVNKQEDKIERRKDQ